MPRKSKKTKPIEAAIEAQTAAIEATPVAAETPVIPETPVAQDPPPTLANETPTATVIPWKATIPIGPTWETTLNLGTRNDAEWTWRKADGYWTQQLAFGQEKQGHEAAERFFFELAALERQARGVETSTAPSR